MFSRTVKVWILATSFALVVLIQVLEGENLESQHWPVLSRAQLQAVIDTVSGETALDHIQFISQYWRWGPSTGFHEVAEYVVKQAKSYGLSDAHIERFIADRTTLYLGAPIYAPSWDPLAAELWVVEPVHQKITSFDDIPMCVAGYSRNTDVIAELVNVGEGTSPEDYAGKDVKGKIVLGTGAVGVLQQMAVFERGALGVLSAWTPEFQTSRAPIDYPDQVAWGLGVVPESKTGRPSTFGFMLSERQRHDLLNLLKTHKEVMMHAIVRAGLIEPGYLEVAAASIPGREFAHQELILTAHLDHPKPAANDNASGSATLLEIARVLQTLVRSGQLPPPKRTIRFLWLEEGSSTLAYIDRHPEVLHRAFAVINLDIVGDDQQKTKGILYYWRSSSSHPSFVSDVAQDFFELVRNINNDRMPTEPLHPILAPTGNRRPFVGEVQRFRRGSDHSFFVSSGVPAVNFADWPDQFHHTQFDTPEKSDPTQLKRVAFIGAASAAALSGAGPDDAIRIATNVVGRGRTRLGEDLTKGLHLLDRTTAANLPQSYKEARNVVHQGYVRECQELDSVRLLAGKDPTALGYLRRQEEALAESEARTVKHAQLYYESQARRLGVTPQPIETTNDELRSEKRIPAWAGAYRVGAVGEGGLAEKLNEPDIRHKLRIFRYNWQVRGPFVFYATLFETLNLIDGKRSVKEIRDVVSAEYDPVPLDVVEELIDAMAKAKLIKIQTP
jgi:hypothetical protein